MISFIWDLRLVEVVQKFKASLGGSFLRVHPTLCELVLPKKISRFVTSLKKMSFLQKYRFYNFLTCNLLIQVPLIKIFGKFFNFSSLLNIHPEIEISRTSFRSEMTNENDQKWKWSKMTKKWRMWKILIFKMFFKKSFIWLEIFEIFSVSKTFDKSLGSEF